MSFYSEMTAVALDLLTEFGEDFTFVTAGSTPDPITGLIGIGGSDGSPFTVKGVLTMVDERAFPETRVETGDRAMIVEGDIDFAMDTTWIDGTNVWAIAALVPVMPNGSDIVITKILLRG